MFVKVHHRFDDGQGQGYGGIAVLVLQVKPWREGGGGSVSISMKEIKRGFQFQYLSKISHLPPPAVIDDNSVPPSPSPSKAPGLALALKLLPSGYNHMQTELCMANVLRCRYNFEGVQRSESVQKLASAQSCRYNVTPNAAHTTPYMCSVWS